MSRAVGVVIPTFRPNVDALEAYVTAIANTIEPDVLRIELDDASPETEADVIALDGAVGPTDVTVNSVGRRRGKGAAITAGFEALDAEVLAFADDDGSTLVPSLGRVVEAVRSGDSALAVASRYHPESRVHESRHRRLNGKCFAWTSRRMLPVAVTDYQCGAKAIDRATWRAVRNHLCEPGFAWDLELLAMTHAMGYAVDEVPVSWVHDPDSTAESIGTAVELLRSLVTVRHRTKRLRGDPLHVAIAERRRPPRPLVDTAAPPNRNE